MTIETPLVSVRDLSVHFRGNSKNFRAQIIKAVDGVSFEILQGETLGIAGESGSGKSTLARTLIGINRPTSGSIQILGEETSKYSNTLMRPIRKKIQMVFQDPYDSLDPRFTVAESIAEGLQIRNVPKKEIPSEVMELLSTVKLSRSLASRFPSQLSGGQRQRVAIARSLATKPDLIICDEAVAALDVSVRAQILNLLQDIQEQTGVSYLFISHDLSTLRYISKNVAIMYGGRIVEFGNSDAVLTDPQHPYTRALINSVPKLSVVKEQRNRIVGEPPDPANLPNGCSFNLRCPEAIPVCSNLTPQLLSNSPISKVACHVRSNSTIEAEVKGVANNV